MSGFERFKGRTRINTNLPDFGADSRQIAQDFNQQSADFLGMSRSFFGMALEDAKKEGAQAGKNALILQPDGSIARMSPPEGAGSAYLDAFQGQQNQAYSSEMSLALKTKADQILKLGQRDPEAALKAVDEEYLPFAAKLSSNAGDMAPSVNLRGEAFRQALTNSLQAIIAQGIHDDNVAKINTQLDTMAANIANQHAAGVDANESGAEEVSLLDIMEGDYLFELETARKNRALTAQEYENKKVTLIESRVQGQYIAAVNPHLENNDVVSAMAALFDAEKNPPPGFSQADMGKLTAAAMTTVKNHIELRNRKDTEATKTIAKDLEYTVSRVNDVLLKGEATKPIIDGIFLPLMGNMQHPKVQAAYFRAMSMTQTQIKDAMGGVYERAIIEDMNSLELGKNGVLWMKKNIRDGKYGPKTNDALTKFYSWQKSAMKNMLTKARKGDDDQRFRMWTISVESGMATPSTLTDWMREDSDMGRWARENRGKLREVLTQFDKSRGWSNSKADASPGGVDYWKRHFGQNPIDIMTAKPDQLRDLAADKGNLHHLPPTVKTVLTNWRIGAQKPDKGRQILNIWKAYELAGHGHKLPGMNELQVGQLEAALAAHDRDPVKGYAGFVSNLTIRSDEQIGTEKVGKEIISDEPVFRELVETQLKAISEDSAAWDQLINGLLGNKNIFGSELVSRTNFSDTDLTYDMMSPGFRRLLHKHFYTAYTTNIAFGNKEQAVAMALDAISGTMAGSTNFVEGNSRLVTHSWEKAVGTQYDPEKMLQATYLSMLDRIEAKIKASGYKPDQLNEDTVFTLFTKDSDLLNLVEGLVSLGQRGEVSDSIYNLATGRFQYGALSGGDVGQTFREQIADFGRYSQARKEGRLFLRSTNPGANTFDVALKLGDLDDNNIVWIRNVRPDHVEKAQYLKGEWDAQNAERMAQDVFNVTLSAFNPDVDTSTLRSQPSRFQLGGGRLLGRESSISEPFPEGETTPWLTQPAEPFDGSDRLSEPTAFQLQRGPLSADGEPDPIDLEAHQNRLRGEPVTGDQITAAPQQPPAAAPAPAPAPAPTLAPQPIPTIDLTPPASPAASPAGAVDANYDEFTGKVISTFAQIESSGGKFKRNKKSGSTATGTYQVTDGTATGPQPKELVRLGLKPAKSTSMDDKDAYALDRVSALLTYFTGDLDKVAVAWYKGFSGAKKWDGKLKSLSAKERNYVKKWRKEYQRQL